MLNLHQKNVNMALFFAQLFIDSVKKFHNFNLSIEVTKKLYQFSLNLAKKTAEPFIAFTLSLGEKLGITSVESLCKVGSVGTSWLLTCFIFRVTLKRILTYEQFLFENPRRGGISLKTKIWGLILQMFRGNPKLYHCQAALPSLPVPSIKDTVDRYLDSIEPVVSEKEFEEFRELGREFQRGLGPQLQRYLYLKSLLTTNYISDWWEQFIYLKSRGPLAIKSNYYGIGRVGPTYDYCSQSQTAVAATAIQALYKWRHAIETENVNPQCIPGTKRPICMDQYKRLFNTTRIPATPEEDEYVCYNNLESRHVVVIHKGRYWKVRTYDDIGRMLTAAELQDQLLTIINDKSEPQPGEDYIAVMTATDRTPWHHFRENYMLTSLVNRKFLEDIESSSFVVSLDENEYNMELSNAQGQTNLVAKSCLHGHNGRNIWFDKSFNIIVFKNGYWGFNAEHGFADAPVLGMTLEKIVVAELNPGYDAVGNALGRRILPALEPKRMTIQLTRPAIHEIQANFQTVKANCDDTDMSLFIFEDFGKKVISRTLKTSPDAFLQTVLQMAHYFDKGYFTQTYESAMTRLFRNGRTETIRSCTKQMKKFVTAILGDDPSQLSNINSFDDYKNSDIFKSLDKKEVRKLFDQVASKHQRLACDAMRGQGVDRHLFGLYVVCFAIGLKSQFLEKFSNVKWGLSTSQTPSYQLAECMAATKKTGIVGAGGGFGPVDDNGYGISYIILGDDKIYYHVSSCVKAESTDSARFCQQIKKCLYILKFILEKDE